MYTVERVQKDMYGLCKLASWLKERDISDLVVFSQNYPIAAFQRNIASHNAKDWWHQAALDGDRISELDKRLPKRLRASMMRPTKVQPVPTLSIDKEHPSTGALPDVTRDISVEQPPISTEEPLSGPQICENLASQYLEALYLSKTSLAYFAKGPISRARAAFTSAGAACLPVYELTSFLRSILLTHSSMDKKYREKLPEIIRAVPPGSVSDDEAGGNGFAKIKKGKSKRMRLSKDGMYPYEEQYVKKWWLSDVSGLQGYGEETYEERLKRRISDLRIRETLAQLIFMLEILALEALPTHREPQPEDDERYNESRGLKDPEAKPNKKKRKKLQDIKLLIDLLLDKLCIWQSVEEDESISFQAKPSKYSESLDTNSIKAVNGDRLRSFCVEVIVPFYMSRLPEQAASINKKLGGPVATSPKRKAIKPPITSRRPGESGEPDPKKSRRSLGRTPTDTTKQTSQRPTPSLHRSATDSALIPSLKREGSEVPLSAIPFQRSPSTASSRQALSQFKRLSQREVDLSTKSAATEAKLKQKKRVEDELKEAISTLKKPNRGAAVGGYIDEVESRGLGVIGRSKRPANPSRKALQTVQVTATPKRVRRPKDIVQATPTHHHTPFNRIGHGELVPPPSSFRIPSSAVRPPPSFVPRPDLHSISRPENGQVVAETPSRGSRKTVSFFTNAAQLEKRTEVNTRPHFSLSHCSTGASPSKKTSGDTTIFQTPSKPRAHRLDVGTQDINTSTVFATPVKTGFSTAVAATPGAKSAAIFDTPVKATVPAPTSIFTTGSGSPKGSIFATPVGPVSKVATAVATAPMASTSDTLQETGKGKSIYDALGWDDDDIS